jgi:hypothetical protein
MADGINIRIGLEGDADIKRKLDNINAHGEKFGKDISKSLNQAVGTNPALGKAFGAEEGVEKSREAVERFREVLHTLHPILDEAGLGLGNLGAFARVAGAGMGALAAAVVGSLLVGLAKVAEQADRTGARLKALTGSDFANKNLTARAKDLGTAPDKLAPFAEQEEGFVQRRRAVQDVRGGVSHPPGFQPGPENEAAARVQIFNGRGAIPGGPQSSADVAKFTDTLLQAARIDKTPSEEARAGVSALEQSTFKSGKVTPADLDAVNRISPSIGKEIAKAFSGSAAQGGLGRSFQNLEEVKASPQVASGQLSIDQLIAAVNKASPAIKERAEAIPPGITDSLEHLEAAARRAAEALSGDVGLAGAVEKFAKGIDKTTGFFDRHGSEIKDAAGRGAEIGAKLPIPGSSVFGGAIGAGAGVAGGLLDELASVAAKSRKDGAAAEPIPPLSFQRPEFSAKPATVAPRTEAEPAVAPIAPLPAAASPLPTAPAKAAFEKFVSPITDLVRGEAERRQEGASDKTLSTPDILQKAKDYYLAPSPPQAATPAAALAPAAPPAAVAIPSPAPPSAVAPATLAPPAPAAVTVTPVAAQEKPAAISPAKQPEPVAPADQQYEEAVRRGRAAKETGAPDETPLYAPLNHPPAPSSTKTLGPRSEAAPVPGAEPIPTAAAPVAPIASLPAAAAASTPAAPAAPATPSQVTSFIETITSVLSKATAAAPQPPLAAAASSPLAQAPVAPVAQAPIAPLANRPAADHPLAAAPPAPVVAVAPLSASAPAAAVALSAPAPTATAPAPPAAVASAPAAAVLPALPVAQRGAPVASAPAPAAVLPAIVPSAAAEIAAPPVSVATPALAAPALPIVPSVPTAVATPPPVTALPPATVPALPPLTSAVPSAAPTADVVPPPATVAPVAVATASPAAPSPFAPVAATAPAAATVPVTQVAIPAATPAATELAPTARAVPVSPPASTPPAPAAVVTSVAPPTPSTAAVAPIASSPRPAVVQPATSPPVAANSPADTPSPDNVTNGPRSDLGTAPKGSADFRAARAAADTEAPVAPPAIPATPATPAAKPEFEYIPPPKNEFQYIPPPSTEEQRQLEHDRLQPPLSVPTRGPQWQREQDRLRALPPPIEPSSQQPQPPPNTPIQSGQAAQPEQLAGLEQIVRSISGLINGRPKDTNIDYGGGGIRGEGGTTGDDATRKVADLGIAAKAAPEAATPPAAAAAGAAIQEVASLAPAANAAQAGLSSLTQAVAADVQRLDANQTPAAPSAAPAAPATAEQPQPVTAATGGHIRGPGSTTSDSIPAMLSDKEYVLNAKAVERVGVDNLDAINSGTAHFAEGGVVRLAAGGQAKPPHLGPGPHQITYDPDSGGAYIDGNLHVPGDPLLADPVVKSEIEKSKAGAKDSPSQKSKDPFVASPSGDSWGLDKTGDTGGEGDKAFVTSGFATGGLVGHFAGGGSVGSSSPSTETRFREVISRFANGGRVWPSSPGSSWRPDSHEGSSVGHFAQGGVAAFRDRLSAMGMSTVEMPHLAIGGMPEMPSADLSKSSLQPANSNGAALHPVTMNFPWGGSIDGLHAEPDAMRQLSAAAQKAKRYSTGPKPAWYGAGGQ